jgi:plastocyanin
MIPRLTWLRTAGRRRPVRRGRSVVGHLAIVVALLPSVGTARAACTDPDAVAATRAAAELQCPCATASAHGAYIRCVARVAKAAARSGSLPKPCRTAVIGCARKSTCGAPGFVTCCRTTATGRTKCSVKPSAAKCSPPRSGSACLGALPSCCDGCTAGNCAAVTTTTTPGGTTTTTAAGPTTHVVTVGDGGALTFSPAAMTIQIGDTVRWVWESSGHNVVSGMDGNADHQFCSPSDTGCDNPPLSSSGTTYEHTFMQAGSFPYHCSVHFSVGMTGTVHVR